MTDCGWHQSGGCLVTGELIAELLDGREIPDGEWPACSRSHECQWQQELPDDTPCPPRLAVMLGENPEKCTF